MERTRIAFIVNKTAGRNRTASLWTQLEPRLRSRQGDFSVFFTSHKGSGSRLAQHAQGLGFNRIIVVGGDGTLHEAVNGIHPGSCQIGIIPTGTGNDFCRSLGIPLDPYSSGDYIFDNNLRLVDLGRVNGHMFINVAGVGFDAQVAEKVNTSPMLKALSGTAAYLLGVLVTLVKFRNIPLTVTVDGTDISGRVFLAAIGNARYYGGGMEIVPQAVIDDGLFHLCIARDVNTGDALMTLPKIFTGRHVEHPKVTCVYGENVTITAPKPTVVHADGEIVSVTPATFEILPASLAVVCPPPETA